MYGVCDDDLSTATTDSRSPSCGDVLGALPRCRYDACSGIVLSQMRGHMVPTAVLVWQAKFHLAGLGAAIIAYVGAVPELCMAAVMTIITVISYRVRASIAGVELVGVPIGIRSIGAASAQ
eukprot:COSAG01_NODE_679_length_14296_cov_250.437575_5_plen_121_part_00